MGDGVSMEILVFFGIVAIAASIGMLLKIEKVRVVFLIIIGIPIAALLFLGAMPTLMLAALLGSIAYIPFDWRVSLMLFAIFIFLLAGVSYFS